MSPMPEAPPVADTGRRADQSDMEQAGRSTISLEAQKSSAALRSEASTASFKTPMSVSQESTSDLESPVSVEPPTTFAHAPLIPSPLNDSTNSSLDEPLEITSLPRPSDSSSQLPSVKSVPVLSAAAGKSSKARGQRLRKQNHLQHGWRHSIAAAPREASKRLARDMGLGFSRYPLSGYGGSQSRELTEPDSSATLLGTGSSTTSLTKNPFSDSYQAKELSEKWLYYDEKMGMTNFDPYADGDKDFIRYKDEVEADDVYHMPTPSDAKRANPTFRDVFAPRIILSTIAFFCLTFGLVLLFVLVPVMIFTGMVIPAPTTSTTNSTTPDYGPPEFHVNNNTYPLCKNVRTTLVDPDTPQSAMTRKSTFDGEDLKLVFSDEFNVPNRTFYPGDDPFWTAPDIWYGATQDMEWYDPDAVTTANGTLQLRLDNFPNHNLQYRSGMLNSWNQLCFKGGVMEVSLSLPGPSGTPGLWPGVWSMGNLGRPGYRATTDGVWPYTYNDCDLGITPNQSSPDGMSYLPGQKLSSCTCDGESHPNPGTGRGAPEIDVIEASVDPNNLIGVVTQSFQVAPFDIFWRPNNNFLQIPNYETTQMNAYCGGPYQQAVSGTTLLNNDWYDGQEYQKFAFEYIPGTSDGKIAWFVGEDRSFMMDGRAIGENGNVMARQVSEEPMSMILNLGFSSSWSYIDFAGLEFPTIMRIDYVRIYQREGQEMITCDPPGYPTTQYIEDHMVAYTNPNLTLWNETGYEWPKNKLNSNC